MGLRVIIVGAGLGGLATAVALRQSGHQVLVLEKRTGKKEIGQAVTVPPNASKILKSFGLDLGTIGSANWLGMDVVKADVDPMVWETEHKHVDMEALYGGPSLNVHRRDYHSALKTMATSEDGPGEKVEIREDCNVIGFDAEKAAVELEGGEMLTADLVVAADGVKSTAHKWVVGEERPAKLTKTSNVRFVVPTEVIMNDPEMAQIMAKGGGRAGLYSSSSNTVSLFRSPMNNNEVQNFGVYQIADPLEESGKWVTQTNRQIALDRLRNFNRAIARIPEYADEDEMYLWKVADRDPLPKFHNNRLALVGDACHPMQPHLGQESLELPTHIEAGATQAVEDAGILGVVMDGVKDPEEIPRRLELWQDLRMKRASAAVLLSRSILLGPWTISSEDQEKVKEYFDGPVPKTRPEVYHHFYFGDQLKEAREAVHERFGTVTNGHT